MTTLRKAALVLGLLTSTSFGNAADAKTDFFEAKIRPVLIEQCYSCHSAEAEKAKKLKGGFKLDTRESLLKGGESGIAIVPGKPKDSLLMKTLHFEGDIQMPPNGKLKKEIIADFEKWIADGATDPREAATSTASTIDLEKGRKFWAFQQPKKHTTPTGDKIDDFISEGWKKQGLTPAPVADKRTLLRRVYIDLIGLPPTPEQLEAFEKDKSPNAFAKVVDDLLASQHYGERWARYWLDVARYAEDQAHTFAVTPKKNAYMYRDWVIQAYNKDMPYDQFVRRQIAGDQMPDEKEEIFDRMAGLGFLGLGAEYYKNSAKEQAIADELDDRVDTLTRGFLGLTVSCARCHDHKFDPIPQKDYYSIAGIFNGSKFSEAFLAPPAEVKAFQDAQAAMKKMNDQLTKMKKDVKDKPKDESLAAKLKELNEEIVKLTKTMPTAPKSVHVLSGGGQTMKVFVRGNPLKPGDEAPKGFLQVMTTSTASKDYSRLDLANAIGSKDNPLTARVIVNRVWQGHFGRGLVNTPSNFGSLGDKPSHPELLDTLAVKFMENGWSMKWLHRQITLSKTYQLSSQSVTKNNAKDPANVYLWRAERRRLDVESWRDSLLAVAGNLDPAFGGQTYDLRDANVRRRTVYARISRHELNSLLRLFDFPDANVTADKRTETTVPQQQLFALNSDFMTNQAKALDKQIEKTAKSNDEKVKIAYKTVFLRDPSKQESELGLKFLNAKETMGDKLNRSQQYMQILLASNELMYLD